MSAPVSTASPHRWRFYRVGGLDLVQILTADDLRHLGELDPKLWTALACPVKGLEFDEATLALIDTDKDGRIRVPEILAAVKWVCEQLVDPASIIAGGSLPVAEIKDPAMRATAEKILQAQGKEAAALAVADVAGASAVFAKTLINGDGVITPESAGSDAELAGIIRDILATQGSVADRSGAAGVDAGKITAFYADLAAYAAWATKGESEAETLLPYGAQTAAALAALDAVATKIDDFFARTRVAAFDSRALAALNRAESEYQAIAARDLTGTASELEGFPLAKVAPGAPLPLLAGVNPAWADRLATFARVVVTPIFGEGTDQLWPDGWATLKARLAPYRAWMAAKAGSKVESLGMTRIQALLAEPAADRLQALVTADAAVAPEYAALAPLERLARYHRDLYRLLLNFVSFSDFFSQKQLAIFQAGRLFLDSRQSELVVRVADAAKHAALATHAKIYLAYCDCTRPATGEKMSIAVAFLNGDSDRLMVGRNGIFYDRQGRDWDATITKVIDNPISLREAFWSPYKKFVQMIEDQVAKRAAAADASAQSKLASAAETTANADKAKPAAEPKKIDVGTVAALGVAVSGFVAVFTAIIGGILGLSWWQIPLAVLGVMLAISGPSMIIASLKLRQRNLGPLLDANGWAINGRVKLTIPFGAALTRLAHLPAGAERSLQDPYAEKKQPWALYLVLIALIVGAIAIYADRLNRGHYFWQPAPAPVVIEVPVATPAAETPAP